MLGRCKLGDPRQVGDYVGWVNRPALDHGARKRAGVCATFYSIALISPSSSSVSYVSFDRYWGGLG